MLDVYFLVWRAVFFLMSQGGEPRLETRNVWKLCREIAVFNKAPYRNNPILILADHTEVYQYHAKNHCALLLMPPQKTQLFVIAHEDVPVAVICELVGHFLHNPDIVEADLHAEPAATVAYYRPFGVPKYGHAEITLKSAPVRYVNIDAMFVDGTIVVCGHTNQSMLHSMLYSISRVLDMDAPSDTNGTFAGEPIADMQAAYRTTCAADAMHWITVRSGSVDSALASAFSRI